MIGILLAGGAVAVGARGLDSGDDPAAKPAAAKKKALRPERPAPPAEIRGVHVTMALASLPGKLDEYTETLGLNTIELDVKDENGEVAYHGLARRWRRRSARRSATTIPSRPQNSCMSRAFT